MWGIKYLNEWENKIKYQEKELVDIIYEMITIIDIKIRFNQRK